MRSGIPGLELRLQSQVENDSRDVEAKYLQVYEYKLNPFAEVHFCRYLNVNEDFIILAI
jgi:hypothetical protein